MDRFHYLDGELYAEQVPASTIAEEFGTPCYVYSRAVLESRYRTFDDALGDYPHRICFSVKANSNIAVLNLLARLGSGFDIVSAGELERVLAAGGSASSVLFSGVGKRADEILRALEAGIGCFNVESASELRLIEKTADAAGKIANVAMRVNPDVDPGTHPYIATGLRHTKFGIASDRVIDIYREASRLPHIRVVGIDCHIGSQITTVAPFVDACKVTLGLIDDLREEGIEIEHLNMGGGLGIRYQGESPPEIAEYVRGLLGALGDRNLQLILEPGRAIAAQSGILLTRVLYLKENGERQFAIVDAGMNDLLRPALYQAWQNVIPVRSRNEAAVPYDIVGPVCESGDFIAKDRTLSIAEGDLLAVEGAGAYGFVMSSNYNSRGRVPEIIVDDAEVHLVRERESIVDQLTLEHVLPGN